jgi:hypothetical protein
MISCGETVKIGESEKFDIIQVFQGENQKEKNDEVRTCQNK